LILGSASSAGSERPYIGVLLDPAPLPELLAKHLNLDAGQGIRISNITVDSPADQAGLERDDIIIAFQDEKVTSSEQLVDAVRRAGIGTEISLDIIHFGQRKTLKLALEPLQPHGKPKYPPEPEIVTSWRPGKFFRIGPEGRQWVEIPFDRIPEFDLDVRSFVKELHTYHHKTDSEDYTITIEGDPADEDSSIVVRSGESEYRTTVGEIDALPEEYREPVREAVDSARDSVKKDVRIRGRFRLPEPPRPDIYEKYFRAIPRPDLEHWSEQKDRALEELREQMDRLQEGMKELERRNREMFEKLLDKKQAEEGRDEEPEAPASSAPGHEQAI
jgi:hypothetical protein